jgi:hypothetical protein
VLGVVAILALATIGFFGVQALSGDDEPVAGTRMTDMARADSEEGAARADVAAAVADGDTEALATLATDQPAALEDVTDAVVGEPATATVNGAGYAVFTFEAEADGSYTVTAERPDGDAAPATAILPPEGAPVAPADTFDATGGGGPHRLVVAAGDEAEGEVTVTVKQIEVIPVDLTAAGTVDGEIAEPGDAVAYEHEAEVGSHYIVDIDNLDLTVTVTDPEGAVVPTVPDIDLGTPRYVTDQAGPYRVTIGGGAEGTTGSFSGEIFEVAEFFFYYDGEAGNDLVLERTTEEFQAPIAEDEQRAHFCLFLREGITMNLDIRVTSATLDMGIDVFDETDSGPLVARVNDVGPGESELWSVTAQHDVNRCFQLWAVDYTGGNFIISFTTES